MAMIYRNAGAWGAGKGARLTSLEADGNVYDLDGRVRSLEDNPPEAIGIDHFAVSGNALTIYSHQRHRRHGPFTLPSAQWRWAGEWQPLTNYYALDLVGYAGSIYLVQHNHTSAAAFAADAEDIARLSLRSADRADRPALRCRHVSIPRSCRTTARFCCSTSRRAPSSCRSDLPTSTAYLLTPVSTENIALPIHKNGIEIGHIEFNLDEGLVSDDGGQLGTFVGITPAAEVQFTRTDRLSILAPDVADDTAAGLSITFAGRAGTI